MTVVRWKTAVGEGEGHSAREGELKPWPGEPEAARRPAARTPERFVDPFESPAPEQPLHSAPPPSAPASEAEPTGETLDSVRGWITDVDRQIVSLLARRQRLARRALTLEGRAPEGLYDPAREAAVVREAAERGGTLGLDPQAVRDLYWHIVALCRRAQRDER